MISPFVITLLSLCPLLSLLRKFSSRCTKCTRCKHSHLLPYRSKAFHFLCINWWRLPFMWPFSAVALVPLKPCLGGSVNLSLLSQVCGKSRLHMKEVVTWGYSLWRVVETSNSEWRASEMSGQPATETNRLAKSDGKYLQKVVETTERQQKLLELQKVLKGPIGLTC